MTPQPQSEKAVRAEPRADLAALRHGGIALARYRRDADFTGKAERTRRSYDDRAVWLREHFGDLPLAAVTPATVRVLKRAGASTPAQTKMRLRFLRLVPSWAHFKGQRVDPF